MNRFQAQRILKANVKMLSGAGDYVKRGQLIGKGNFAAALRGLPIQKTVDSAALTYFHEAIQQRGFDAGEQSLLFGALALWQDSDKVFAFDEDSFRALCAAAGVAYRGVSNSGSRGNTADREFRNDAALIIAASAENHLTLDQMATLLAKAVAKRMGSLANPTADFNCAKDSARPHYRRHVRGCLRCQESHRPQDWS